MRLSHKTDWVPAELLAFRRIKARLMSDGMTEHEADSCARKMVERFGSHARRTAAVSRGVVR